NLLYGGILELLLNLEQKGCKCFLATSKPTVYAKQILDNLKIRHFFTEIVGSNLDLTRTSKSAIIQAIIGKLTQEEKSQVIMIGDTKYDIEGAHAEHIDSIAVLYGYGTEEDFSSTSPIKIVKTVAELSHFLLFCKSKKKAILKR
ncbi:MAG: HAD hydrolase-like protein, partial [Bacteroidales bacterium]|nr:HAD hydrolase-like protein [Bacteroidales bacterium]